MEFANRSDPEVEFLIREAKRSDADKILQLLQTAVYRHINVDWYVPGDWLGKQGFVVLTKETGASGPAARLLGPREKLFGCLAVGADVDSLAWVRLAAVADVANPQKATANLLTAAWRHLPEKGVYQVAWLAIEDWPRTWFEEMGFTIANEIETYIKDDTAVLDVNLSEVAIRPVKRSDIERLVAIEQEAFDPLWQHSVAALNMAYSQALSFDVVLLADEIAGFQLSARSESGAHLVRMTINPAFQGQGIGSALLAHALHGYHQAGLTTVSLNTQIDNISSQALYRKFGFRPTGYRLPIWLKELPHE